MPITVEQLGKPVMMTLHRRADRLAESMREIHECPDWAFGEPELFYGFDGLCATRPTRIQNKLFGVLSEGGWGCTMSYAWLINQFLQTGNEWLTVMEDDVWLVNGFSGKCAEFLAAVPDDADTIYIGGNPRDMIKYPPVRINDLVCRPHSITATHFFAISRKFALEVEPWLLEDPIEICDARIARLHKLPGMNSVHGGKYNVYLPLVELAGQVMGKSDILPQYNANGAVRQIWGVPEARQAKMRPIGSDVTELDERWKPQETV